MPCALGLATYTLNTEAELSSETFVPNKLDGVIFQKRSYLCSQTDKHTVNSLSNVAVCTSGDGVLVSRRLRGDELGEELCPSETLRNLL